MRIVSYAILVFSILAMGGKRPDLPDGSTTPPVSPSVPATIDPHYTRFKEFGKTFGARFVATSVTFSFRGFVGSTVGMCTFSSSGRNSVALSTSAWDRGSETFREMLLFHELGHCLLGRGHKNSNHSDGRRESIMASAMFSQKVYLAHRDQYLKELFTAETAGNLRVVSRARASDDSCAFGH